jgi:uncharacterized membrane protein (DUF4010 family)
LQYKDGVEPYEPFVSLAVALAAGLLIGLEREQSAPVGPPERLAFLGGARTHPLFSLLGAIVTLLGVRMGAVVPGLAFAGVLAFVAIAYAREVRRGDANLTAAGALLLSFVLGALAAAPGVTETTSHRLLVVLSLAVVVTLLLSSRPWLHAFIKGVSRDDVLATLKFLLVAVIVLPLAPDRGVGPLGAVNPRNVALMVVLISAVSFVGYVAVRWLGPQRGLGITGAAGGLVSSTAVTLAMAGRSRRDAALAGPCAQAVAIACAIMCLRVLAMVAVVRGSLLADVALPLGGMAAGGLAASAVLFVRSRHTAARGEAVTLGNPFELASAVKFGLLFALVLLGSRLATEHLGTAGTYLSGLLAGVADVDAITLSMSRLAGDQVTNATAATTIALATVSNTLVKTGLAIGMGDRRFARLVTLTSLAMLAGGGLGIVLLVR